MKRFAITRYREPLECIEVTRPEPTGSEVLLKVRAAGVCHTDIHVWEGGYDMGGGTMLKMADRGQTLPHTMGHETVGEVVAFGPEARGVALGDVRLIYPWIGCGDCAVCRADEEHLCTAPQYLGIFRPGGYADHILVKHPRYLVDIGGIPEAQAAPCACSGLTAYSALRKLGKDRLSQPILIVGAGGLGLMCLSLLKAMGAAGAVVADVDPVKRQAALDAGALAAIDPAAPDAGAAIAAACGGPLRSAVDFVGSPASWSLAMGSLVKGGFYVIVGLYGGQTTLPIASLPLRAITVSGSFVGSRPELIELVALMASGKVTSPPVTTRPLAQVNAALTDLREGRIVGRAVLQP